jgi:hypothetical protein
MLNRIIERGISDRIKVRIDGSESKDWLLLHLEYRGFPYDKKRYEDKNVFFILGIREAREFINMLNREVCLAEELNKEKK